MNNNQGKVFIYLLIIIIHIYFIIILDLYFIRIKLLRLFFLFFAILRFCDFCQFRLYPVYFHLFIYLQKSRIKYNHRNQVQYYQIQISKHHLYLIHMYLFGIQRIRIEMIQNGNKIQYMLHRIATRLEGLWSRLTILDYYVRN